MGRTISIGAQLPGEIVMLECKEHGRIKKIFNLKC